MMKCFHWHRDPSLDCNWRQWLLRRGIQGWAEPFHSKTWECCLLHTSSPNTILPSPPHPNCRLSPYLISHLNPVKPLNPPSSTISIKQGKRPVTKKTLLCQSVQHSCFGRHWFFCFHRSRDVSSLILGEMWKDHRCVIGSRNYTMRRVRKKFQIIISWNTRIITSSSLKPLRRKCLWIRRLHRLLLHRKYTRMIAEGSSSLVRRKKVLFLIGPPPTEIQLSRSK